MGPFSETLSPTTMWGGLQSAPIATVYAQQFMRNSLCATVYAQQFMRNSLCATVYAQQFMRNSLCARVYAQTSLTANGVFHAANRVLHLAFELIGFAFAFGLGIAGDLAGCFLGFASNLFGRTFDAILINHFARS